MHTTLSESMGVKNLGVNFELLKATSKHENKVFLQKLKPTAAQQSEFKSLPA